MSSSDNLQTARRRQAQNNDNKVEAKVSEQSALNISEESKPVEVCDRVKFNILKAVK